MVCEVMLSGLSVKCSSCLGYVMEEEAVLRAGSCDERMGRRRSNFMIVSSEAFMVSCICIGELNVLWLN